MTQLNILVIGNSESGKTSLIDALESVVSNKKSKRQTSDDGLQKKLKNYFLKS